MAGLDYFASDPRELPRPAYLARALLWFISISTLIGSLSWFLDGTNGTSLGQALFIATPGALGIYLARRFIRGGERLFWILVAFGTLYVLIQIVRILNANAFGLVGLPLTAAFLGTLLHPTTRARLRRPPPVVTTKNDKDQKQTPPAESGVSMVQYAALLGLVASIVAGMMFIIPNATTPSVKTALCRIFVRDGCGGTSPNNGQGDKPPITQPKPQDKPKDCDWKCKLKNGWDNVVDYGGDVVGGIVDSGKELYEDTKKTVTDAGCMVAKLGCSDAERDKIKKEYEDLWNKIKDDPLGYLKETGEAAIKNCKDFLGSGSGNSLGQCIVDVGGVIITKKPRVKIPGNGKHDGDKHDGDDKPNAEDPNDKDKDGKPDCQVVALAYRPAPFGRMSAGAVLFRAAPCPISQAADNAEAAAGRAKTAAENGDPGGVQKAVDDAQKAVDEAIRKARETGSDPDKHPEVQRARRALKEAQDRLDAQKQIAQSGNDAENAAKRTEEAAPRGDLNTALKGVQDAEQAVKDAIQKAKDAGVRDPENHPDVLRAKAAHDRAKTKYEAQKTNGVGNDLRGWNSKRYQFGDKQFLLDKANLTHILERHHPKYWLGETKQNQSFFDKNQSIQDIESAISSVLNQNRDRLSRRGSRGMYQIEGTYNGKKYVLGLNNGHIGQFYPVV